MENKDQISFRVTAELKAEWDKKIGETKGTDGTAVLTDFVRQFVTGEVGVIYIEPKPPRNAEDIRGALEYILKSRNKKRIDFACGAIRATSELVEHDAEAKSKPARAS